MPSPRLRSSAPSFLPLLLLAVAACGSPISKRTQARIDRYIYEDTKQLVLLVEDAATLVEQRGRAAFPEFAVPDSRWFNQRTYIFVYETGGTCVFHPVNPGLVGKNMMDMRDMNGKAVIRRIAEIGIPPAPDASGWVFYLWEEMPQLVPAWKTSYIRKAIAPDRKVYVVGAGVYNAKIEKTWVKERVDMAAELLRTSGRDTAFAQFRDMGSVFHFLDVYLFVMDMNGRAVMDAAYPTVVGRDLTDIRDAVDRRFVRELLDKLKDGDEAWVQHMWPMPGSILPSRKLVYARKVVVGSETLVVGSDFFIASPIWMRL